MISGIMTPKGAEDFVAPAALKETLAARIAGYRMEVDASPLKRGDLETFRRDAFDLQRVQTEEALYLMQHEDWDLFWVMTHTLDKLQHFFWRYMDADHPAYPGPGPFQHVIRDFHVAFDQSLARFIEAAPPGTPVVLLSDHGSAPLHTLLLRDELARRRRVSCSERRQRHASQPRRGRGRRPRRRAGVAARGSRLGTAHGPARAQARGAAGPHVVRQGGGADRLEPDPRLLPLGSRERALGQPARPGAPGHRRAGRGVRARRRRAA